MQMNKDAIPQYSSGCWNCVHMNYNICVTVSKKNIGPLFSLGMLPREIQLSHVFVLEQNLFKG